MKPKIDRYYKYGREAFKCIDKEGDIYFFKLVDGSSFGKASSCCMYNNSRLCKKCNRRTACTRCYIISDLKEIPYLKAVLLYEK